MGKRRHLKARCDVNVAEHSFFISFTQVHIFRQQDLFRVLKAYTLHRPEEGYCQAQAPIAAVLLMHMPAEVNTHSTFPTLYFSII